MSISVKRKIKWVNGQNHKRARLTMKSLTFLYFLMVHSKEEKKSQFLHKILFLPYFQYLSRLTMKSLTFLYFLMVHSKEEKKSQFLQKIFFLPHFQYLARLTVKSLAFLYFLMAHSKEKKKSQFLQKIYFQSKRKMKWANGIIKHFKRVSSEA